MGTLKMWNGDFKKENVKKNKNRQFGSIKDK